MTALCLQRNSYINRVYELETRDQDRVIVKLYRPARWTKEMILQEHALLLACDKAELPVVPPLCINDCTLFEREGF